MRSTTRSRPLSPRNNRNSDWTRVCLNSDNPEVTVHFSLDVARALPGRLVYVLFTKQTKTSNAVEISSSIWKIKEDKEAKGASTPYVLIHFDCYKTHESILLTKGLLVA